jgi:hypothetical protein
MTLKASRTLITVRPVGPAACQPGHPSGHHPERLTHRCRIIETKGESYRLQDAKAQTRNPAKPATETLDETPTAS